MEAQTVCYKEVKRLSIQDWLRYCVTWDSGESFITLYLYSMHRRHVFKIINYIRQASTLKHGATNNNTCIHGTLFWIVWELAAHWILISSRKMDWIFSPLFPIDTLVPTLVFKFHNAWMHIYAHTEVKSRVWSTKCSISSGWAILNCFRIHDKVGDNLKGSFKDIAITQIVYSQSVANVLTSGVWANDKLVF